MTGRIALAVLAAFLGTPAGAGAGEKRTLRGSVTFPNSAALPADATLFVRLEETPKPDASRRTLARLEIPAGGARSPIAFALPYDAAAADPARRYSVGATIAAGGRTLWRSAPYPVVTRGGPERVTIVLEAARRARRVHPTPTPTPNAAPAGTAP